MSTRIPITKTTVSYAYTISVNGVLIGNIQEFNITGTRALDRVREIQNELSDTVEIVPGRTDYTITIGRLETYAQGLIQALGYDASADLSQLTTPVLIQEEIKDPVTGGGRKIQYIDCWTNMWTKPLTEGTITVRENITMYPTRVIASKIST